MTILPGISGSSGLAPRVSWRPGLKYLPSVFPAQEVECPGLGQESSVG